MRVTYSNTLLSAEDLALGRVGFGATWNGQPILDVVTFFRSAQSTVYGRGDSPEEFTQRVWRFFNTEAAALSFCALHRSSLPVQADLVIVDDAETIALRLADAVRQVGIAQRVGTAVLVDYKFTGSGFTSEDVPEDTTTPIADRVKTGYITLTPGAESGSIAFDVAFGSKPKIFLQLNPPTGGQMFPAHPVRDTITAAGCDYTLGAAVPASGTYELAWTAIL